ncbi:MAG: hypothetical protein WD625_04575, partial [Balneolales bacterium]
QDFASLHDALASPKSFTYYRLMKSWLLVYSKMNGLTYPHKEKPSYSLAFQFMLIKVILIILDFYPVIIGFYILPKTVWYLLPVS